MKNSLSKHGLSMSEAQSISNICNQKALDIAGLLANINNSSRHIVIDNKDYVETSGNKIPTNIVEMITLKAKYHATQAFLMENIKAKDNLLKFLKTKQFEYHVEKPKLEPGIIYTPIAQVTEEWGKQRLELKEVNDYLLAEATAAHIGQFIHKGSILDNLRKELPNIKTLEWMSVKDGERIPVMVEVHHTQEELSKTYEEFSTLHRQAEQKVNFYKAKIKNLVTIENARIASVNTQETTKTAVHNTNLRTTVTDALKKWNEEYTIASSEFEELRNKEIQEVAVLKITTAPEFQETIDKILKTLKPE